MKRLWLLSIYFFLTGSLFAQSIWTESQEDTIGLNSVEHQQIPTQLRLLKLNINNLQNSLADDNLAQQCIDIPMPDGSDECFLLEETHIIDKKLSTTRKDIKTFKGVSVTNSKRVMYFSQSNDNFHLIGDSEVGTFFIDKVEKEGRELYMSYYAKDEIIPEFACGADDIITPEEFRTANPRNSLAVTAWGTELRKYKMAIMWTPGHVANYGNDTSRIIDRNVEIVTDMNFVCERDLCVTFELAPNPELLIFPDANNNPYSGLGSATGIMNNAIGTENFQIGVVISGGGGGVSYLGVTCGGARGGSQSSNSHWVIVHELGHNMGSGHTFNHCPGWGGAGIEPGAGNSIMSYGGTGVCGAGHQVPGGRINYFHSYSIERMYNKLFLNTNCAENIMTGNTSPSITLPTGGFTIPKSTPFTLTGSATDAEDATNMTYSWEQYQWGVGSNPNAPTVNDPIFRMYPFSDSPSRTIPRINEIINGYNYGEVLPTESRTLNFRFSARDNHAGGSGIAYDNMEFSVTADAGPFEVTYPNDYEPWTVGKSYDVTWDIANTDQAPVNCNLVNILLSVDGGFTYPYTLASNVANDGLQRITVPDTVGTQNRIKVAAADNVFFDISDENFQIFAADAYDYAAKMDTQKKSVCSEATATYQLATTAIGSFSSTIDLSLNGLPTNATLNMSAMVNATSVNSVTIENLSAVAEGIYPMTLTLTEVGGSITKSFDLFLVKKANLMTTTAGQAASFNGVSPIHIPKNNTDFDFSDDESFSVELWTKTTSTSSDDALIADKNWDNGNNKGWVIFMQNGQLGFNAGENGASRRVDVRTSGTTFNDDKWHHVAVSFSRAGDGLVQLFVDGVFYSQATLGHLGSINSEFDLVIGADKDNDYAFEGLIDEVRIWKKALTTTEIRENMHRILNDCETDLISAYQFNEANGNALDAFSHHPSTLTNVSRVTSSAPIGVGTVNTQTETDGTVIFTNTNFSANYTQQVAASVTTTSLNNAPFGTTGIEGGDNILDSKYWVINRYEQTGNLTYNATFTVAEDLTEVQANQSITFKLYGRNFNEDGTWTHLGNALSVDYTNNSITFENVGQYGQFIVTNTTNPVIALSPLDTTFCPTAINTISGNILSYSVQGVNLNSDIIITPPTNFEISLSENAGFTISPINLSPVSNMVNATTIYVRLIPTTTGNISENISHTTTGTNINQAISAIAIPAAGDLPEMAYKGGGNGTPFITIPSLVWQPTVFTVEFWLKPYSLSNWNQQIGVGWGSFLFHAAANGSFYVGTNTGSSRIQSVVNTLQLNEWSHIATTFDNGVLQVYHNGALIGTQNAANLPNLWNGSFKIGLGDANNLHGEVDELRIWETARTQQEIQENMHHTMEVAQACSGGLKVYYQFDTANGQTIKDVLGQYDGSVNGLPTLVTATEPVGEGIANTQIETNGMINFTHTDCSIHYNNQNGTSVVVSKINNAPSNLSNLPNGENPLSNQYWAMHRYGTGDLDMNLTFTVNEDLTTDDGNTPNRISLYGRNAPSDNDWVLVTSANSVNAATNSATFNNISAYQQFLLTRGSPTFRVTESIAKTTFCQPENINILFHLATVFGYIPPNPVTINITGQPIGTTTTLSTNSVDITSPQTVSLEIENTQAAPTGPFTLTVTFSDGSIFIDKTFDLAIQANSLEQVAGSAINFDGKDDHISFQHPSQFDFGGTKNFTFETWVKPNVANATGRIFAKHNTGIAGQYMFSLSNGRVSFHREVAPWGFTGNTVLAANQWYHLAVSYDGTSMRIYVNGVLDNSMISTGGAASNSTWVTMGCSYHFGSPANFLNAQMDELRIWNYARTQKEIRENRHLTVSGCENGLIANFQCNEASGNIISPVNSINGSLIADATRVLATEPLGGGVSFSQIETVGNTPFYFTDCNVDYFTAYNEEAVLTKIENAPYNTTSIIGQDEILDNQYWILNRYGSSNFTGHLTFYPSEIISNSAAQNPNQFSLYGRNSNEAGDWTFLAWATAASDINNSITFNNISSYGQYLITRSEQPIILTSQNSLTFCKVEINDRSEPMDYQVAGVRLNEDVIITAPTGFEISTSPIENFSTNLSLSPTGGVIATQTIYIRFTPTTLGDLSNNLVHTSVGAITNNIALNGTALSPTQSIADQAIYFDGVTAQLDIQDSENINLLNHTVELWFRPDWTANVGSYQTLFAKRSSAGTAISFHIRSNRIAIWNGSTSTQINYNFDQTKWYHLACILNGSGTKVYINGVAIHESAVAYNQNLGTLPIALGSNNNNGEFFKGYIDELKIWDQERTVTQIRENMHLTATVADACENGLVLYYQFDNNNGTISDKLDNYPANLNGDATFSTSDVPVAKGVSITKTISTTGNFSFDNNDLETHLDINFPTVASNGEVVVSYLTGESYHGDKPDANALTGSYWIVHNYGTTTTGLGATMNFTCTDGWLVTNDPITHKGFKRNATARGSNGWILLNTVTNVDVTNSQLTLSGIDEFSQFIPSKGNPTTCGDGQLNGDETTIDCGGSCAPCPECDYTLINSEDFESGWGIWTDGGNNANRNTNASYANSGNASIRLISLGESATTTTGNLDLSAYNQLQISFSYFPRSLDDVFEDFWLQISTDGGAIFNTVEEWNTNDEFTSDVRASGLVKINGTFTANTQLRFRCDASGSQDYVYLDDVQIFGCAISCSDGKQNGDETGIDCGGSCPECQESCLPTYTKNDNLMGKTETTAARDSIMSSAQISGASSITYQAGQVIILSTGFEVQAGATFLAQIADCTSALVEDSPAKNRQTVSFNPPLQHSEILLFPNPVHQNLQIQVNSVLNQTGQITIYNALGELVYAQKVNFSKGQTQLTLPISAYSAGIFWVKFYFEQETKMEVQAFVKMR